MEQPCAPMNDCFNQDPATAPRRLHLTDYQPPELGLLSRTWPLALTAVSAVLVFAGCRRSIALGSAQA
ncbi:hypothetical protein PAPYR_12983 [Paratrimastix pyriformis]|uniref:Uncharacterized protein n=1 Tax=Paratrimastix pyriformis TaxID=342808 RepID=A0ABQ8U103_9EUKA|nr:hypothetical protein PAPYR_12983 [Paratrimastix pyriformis]